MKIWHFLTTKNPRKAGLLDLKFVMKTKQINPEKKHLKRTCLTVQPFNYLDAHYWGTATYQKLEYLTICSTPRYDLIPRASWNLAGYPIWVVLTPNWESSCRVPLLFWLLLISPMSSPTGRLHVFVYVIVFVFVFVFVLLNPLSCPTGRIHFSALLAALVLESTPTLDH